MRGTSALSLAETLAGRVQLVELVPFAERAIHLHLTSNSVQSPTNISENSTGTSWFTQLFDIHLNICDGVQQPRLARELARRIDVMPRLAEIAAALTAQLFNLTNVATRLDLSRNTVNEYVSILQNLFMFQYTPAWSNNQLKRTVKSPKLHFQDTGFAWALLHFDEATLWQDRKRLGQMTETFVVYELRKLASWYGSRLSIFRYRDRYRRDVDIVVEKSRSGIVAIEVKTRAIVKRADFQGIRKLQQHSEKFIAGIVLYDGERVRTLGESLYAIPISCLWLNDW